MTKIKILDDLTIQKIAAGEVVERPSSIVKELIENSLDANAKNIVVEIKDGGKSYIRITDDGDGISEKDLSLAFKRHSTSKLEFVEDLYEIRSLGFRGEALSSISNVSKVEVITKTEDSLAGLQAIVEEGKVLSINPIGSPKGTTMIVNDLFYNLPVRKKFLKSNLIESNKISDIVYKIALGNSGTSFKFIRDNKVVLNTSRNNDLSTHIYSILGKEFSKNLVKTNRIIKDDGLEIKGYISNNHLYRSNRSHQYIYINGRYIDNTSISNAIEKHYKTILPINRFPVYILFLEIDPGTIDVNIHPTKQEIKFANHDEIIEAIEESIKRTLEDSMSIARVSFQKKKPKAKEESLPLLFNFEKDIDKDIIEKNKENSTIQKDISKQNIIIKDLTGEKKNKDKKDSFYNNDENLIVREKQILENYNLSDNLREEKLKATENKEEKIENILVNLSPIGVIFKTYILAEDKLNEKFYFVDQHAAHERIMYERYLREFKEEKIATQQLMSPEIMELTNKEMINFIENISIFESLGFELEEFGNNSIAIRGVPLLFGIPNIKDLFYNLLDNIEENIKSSYDVNLNKIMKIACVNSVKSGDNMEDIEILSLFEQLKLCENPHTCPHGRPTIIEMSKKDIEKEFLRII